MNRIYISLFMTLMLFIASCNNAQTSNSPENPVQLSDYELYCTCPHTTLLIQPYNKMTVAEANKLKSELENNIPKLLDVIVTVKILPTKQLPDSLKNDAKTRYRADKIISWQKQQVDTCKETTTIMGLIHDDISLPYKEHSDWGVLGLSFKGQQTCIISTYRVRNADKNLWKVATHEFIHTFYAYGHCPKKDPKCLMCDANGKPNFQNQTELCDYCKEHIY